MTENNYNKLIDAICELVNLAWDSTSKEEFERLDNAGADIIDCLEEIQQYRAIGTIEEFKQAKEIEAVYGQVKWERDIAISQLEEIGVALGQKMEEFKALKEKNKKQLEAIKLLTIAAICYEENLNIIRKEMRENKELVALYCKLSTVQYTKNTIALSKLADSDIDVNNIESIDEIIRIFDWR